MDNDKIAEHLNDLLKYLHDSRNGYKESAEESKNQKLKSLCELMSNQRNEMINTLEQQVRGLGKEPAQYGSVTAVAHRIFINLKSLVTGHDNEAIVNEIKRGENYLIDQYKQTINQDIPDSLKELLSKQLQTIQDNLQKVTTQSIVTTNT